MLLLAPQAGAAPHVSRGETERAGHAGPPTADLLWVPAQVADASDRAYEPVAIQLIDHAASSIVLAMYLIHEQADDRQPVNRLLNDLLEARHRGVRVELYLNTKFASASEDKVLQTRWMTRLRAAGATVTGLTPSRLWHGKVLIVDDRYVLTGSTNWSVAALKTNGESNLLVDSPTLARQQLARVRSWGVPLPGAPVETSPEPPPPATVLVPLAWLEKGGVLTQMVTRNDERGFDVLLWLLRRASAEGTPAFAVDLTRLGAESGTSSRWGMAGVRAEMIRVIRRLRDRYGIAAIQIHRGRPAWVTLMLPAGPTVAIPGSWTAPETLTHQSSEAAYLALLGEALRQHESVDANTLTLVALSARTGLATDLLRRARQELAHSQESDE